RTTRLTNRNMTMISMTPSQEMISTVSRQNSSCLVSTSRTCNFCDTRDLVTLVGGPYFSLKIGSKGGLGSKAHISPVLLYVPKVDQEINPRLATTMKELCKIHIWTTQLQRLGILASCHILIKDNSTEPSVELYATNEKAFFENFSQVMEKLGTVGLEGDGEEVRSRCDHFKNLNV
ncbi:LOW QUALITY PROTEIN: hypothetical protein HID58_076341, partial [Brassica napus]